MTLDLRASTLSSVGPAEVAMYGPREEEVVLRVDGKSDADAVHTAMLLASLSRLRRPISVVFTSRGRRPGVVESLRESLLAPVLWGTDEPSPTTVSGGELLAGRGALVLPEHRTFMVPTAALSLESRIAFQSAFEGLCRRAGVFVPPRAYGAVATIAFETTSNAEEYGAFSEANSETPDTLRYLIVRLHAAVPQAVRSSVGSYLQDFRAAGHSTGTEWLELLVVDAGVGVAYPSYYVLASENGWPTTSIYDVPETDERARLGVLLNTRESTKGRWGRIINRETARGEGTRAVMIRLSSVRGYVALYTGRSRAQWWYARTTRGPGDVAGFPPYDVVSNMATPFRGSIWHALVPMDAQLTLGLDT